MSDKAKQSRKDVQRLLREDYLECKSMIETLPERIRTEKERLTSIRSSLAGSSRHGNAADRQERDTAIIAAVDQMKADLNVARLEVSVIDKIMKSLTDSERRCVMLFDLNRQRGAVDQLCEELSYDRSMIYEIYNGALDKIYRLYWGRW